MKRVVSRGLLVTVILVLLLVSGSGTALAAPEITLPRFGLQIEGAETPQDTAVSLQILFMLTILALAPSILIMMTSFTRIVIVLSITRNALGLQQTPPNQVLIGLALFLTFFIMAPIMGEIYEDAYQPFVEGRISQEDALEKGMAPLREFMFKQTYKKDMNLFVDLAKMERPETLEDIPTRVLIPAFIVSELKKAFQMSFLIYIPFIVVDMVVASTLMSMGMMMLPPIMISLPFKILLFIMVDGWGMIIKTLVTSFK
ncbi:MAG: flagellar type III secretion system pore protein FliP [Clostridia bacterium]|jgi:flagellar biosynthetic protein FliP